MASIRRLLVSAVVLLGSATVPGVQAQTEQQWEKLEAPARIGSFAAAFQHAPPESPEYMVDNTGNKRGVAPNKGEYNGPVWRESGSFEGYMKKLAEKKAAGLLPNTTTGGPPVHTNSSTLKSRQGGSFWLPTLGPLGKAPHAGDGYVFYRNVLDYGADNTGATNTEEAINAAIIDGNRCGEDCGNTFVLGALIYFPPGTYKVCTPIIQYYLTQFVGDPHDRPIIKGCDEFTGIALIDVDPYIPNQALPDGRGVNWYINQNQFFRQIRNFVFDMTEMPAATDEHGQKLVPTGIHWQVSQACSLQNLLFRMPTAGAGGDPPTHVGVFTENGSGGFVSDLVFEGGAIGWRVGSQQYTATSLTFRNCITAVQMIWDWGFNWHKIVVEGGSIAFNISGRGGDDGQGIGSVSIIDSTVSNVPIGVLTNNHATMAPNIVIDNTAFNNVGAIVIVEGGETLLEGGTTTVDLWAHGRRYVGGRGERATGHVANRPTKPAALLDGSGKLFTRLRPQYEDLPASAFLVATEHGCRNDATGDNTEAINAFLQQALAEGKVAYFPAGIYSVQGTVTFPTGSRIQGSGWSQIQATGSYFGDMENPQVVVRVGEEGDVGTMEIVDMLFTVRGPTAGAIMMEWNVHESAQGAAALWDSHIRVGGGIGTDLDMATCPKFSQNDACICVSMLLHITKQASGYFENFWAWVADHDNDKVMVWEIDSSKSQISLFGARGVLVESQGPVWLYGTGSEHVIFYQYEMFGAKDVYLGHIQTESPYFQPKPVSPSPMERALGAFPGDPDWSDCDKETCEMAWGLRIIDSEGVILHSAGLYSWFNDYGQACLKSEDCQERIMEVRGSRDVSIFNIFTKAVEEIGTGNTDESSIQLADGNQQGYTSEISLWFPEDGEPGGEVVYIGPEVYTTHTAQCQSPPCVFVMPPTTLGSQTTISVPPYTTELEVGATQGGTFVVTTTTVTITIGTVVTDVLPVSNHNVTRGETPGAPFWVTPSFTFPPTGIPVTKPDGVVTTRNVTLPPWPQIISWPGGGVNPTGGPGQTTGPGQTGGPGQTSRSSTTSSLGGTAIPTTGRTTTRGGTAVPTTTTPPAYTYTYTESTYTTPPVWLTCPPSTHYLPQFDARITLRDCDEAVGGTWLDWDCPVTATVEIDEPTTVDFQLGCTRWTGVSEPIPTITEFPPGFELEWVEEDGEEDDDDDTSGCRLWFLFICIDWGRIKIQGWRWKIPGPVVIKGGPPPIRWPPGITIKGTLPGPWPPVTIGRDGKITYPTNRPTNCEEQEIEVLSTSTLISTTVVDGTTSTSTSATTSTIATATACILPEGDYDTTSTTGNACSVIAARTAPPIAEFPTSSVADVSAAATPSSAPVPDDAAEAAETPGNATWTAETRNRRAKVGPRQNNPPPAGYDHAIIWVRNMDDHRAVQAIRMYLTDPANDPGIPGRPTYSDFKEVKAYGAAADGGDWTLFFFVPWMRTCHIQFLSTQIEVADAYGIYWKNVAHASAAVPPVQPKQRRELMNFKNHPDWVLSQISVPPGEKWEDKWDTSGSRLFAMSFDLDDSFGQGQTVYILEDGADYSHEEFQMERIIYGKQFQRPGIQELPLFDWGVGPWNPLSVNVDHGTGVASKVVGWHLGLAKRAQLIIAKTGITSVYQDHYVLWEQSLEVFVRVYNQVKSTYAADPSQRGKIIISCSIAFHGILERQLGRMATDRLSKILKKLEELDVAIITTSRNLNTNDGRYQITEVPTRFADPSAPEDQRVDSLVAVGGVDPIGRLAPNSPHADWMVIAPSWDLITAQPGDDWDRQSVGNSFATPLVAGLVAYWRGLPRIKPEWAEELKKPANVKKLLMYMQRVMTPSMLAEGLDSTQVTPGVLPSPNLWTPFIWTGHYRGKNCLVDPSIHPSCPKGKLSDLEPHGAGCQQPGQQPGAAGPAKRDLVARAGGVCVVRPGIGDGGSGDGRGPDAIGDPITFSPGPASPTCVPGSPGCGTLCRGYYCVPSPTGFPPDRWDPEDPAHRPTTTTRTRPPTTPPPLPSCASYTQTTVCNGSGGRQICISSTVCVTPTLPTLSPSPCATHTPTTVCNGSGGRQICVTSSACVIPTLPPLPETDTAYSGPGCASYTATTMCNGSGGQQACMTDNLCVPSRLACPAWPTVAGPLCSSDYPICFSTTSMVLCARGLTARSAEPAAMETGLAWAPSQPTATAAATARTETTATASPPGQPTAVAGRFRFWRRREPQEQQEQQQEQQQKQEPPRAPEVAPADQPGNNSSHNLAPARMEAAVDNGISINNSTGAIARAKLLGVRQEVPWGCGGHETGGCTVYPVCMPGRCAKLVTVACVQAFIDIKMHPIDTEVSLRILENEETVCTFSYKCITIGGLGCFEDHVKNGIDCGGGNKVVSWTNGLSSIQFRSAKTEGPDSLTYKLYFGQVGGDEWYPCHVISYRVWSLCVDSHWQAYDGICTRSSRARSISPPSPRLLDGPANMNGTAPEF